MRILFLNHNVARRGGTYYRVYDVARYLVQRGHAVTLLTISTKRRWGFQREMSAGVEIVHTPDLLWGVGRTGWDPWDTLNRIYYLCGSDWDIIHAWDSRPAVILPALFARRGSRRRCGKLVIDWADWWGRGGTIQERSGWIVRTFFGPVETFFEESFRTWADGNTVISQALRTRAIGLGVPPETIHILQQGCDIESVQPRDRSECRRELDIPTDVPLIGYVGALIRSDAELLFETVRKLLRQRSDCRVVMIGNHRARIPDDLKDSGRVIETGFIPDADFYAYLGACDVMLAPMADTIASRARWPSKVNPFLAAGRATVITRVGDLAALVEHESAAAVVPCQAVDIAALTLELLDNKPLRERYEIRARQLAEGKLAWRDLVAHLERFYADLPNRAVDHQSR